MFLFMLSDCQYVAKHNDCHMQLAVAGTCLLERSCVVTLLVSECGVLFDSLPHFPLLLPDHHHQLSRWLRGKTWFSQTRLESRYIWILAVTCWDVVDKTPMWRWQLLNMQSLLSSGFRQKTKHWAHCYLQLVSPSCLLWREDKVALGRQINFLSV
jgi:hypothetical protein